MLAYRWAGLKMRFFRQIGDLKGWRRFGFEVAIIVFGVGIALVAEQFITNASRARDTEQAMDAVETELMLVLIFSSERMAVEPCRRAQERALGDRLQQAGGSWTGEVSEELNQGGEAFVLPIVARTPFRPWPDSAWRALLASDAAIYMDRDRFSDLSAIFDAVSKVGALQMEAMRLRGRLSHLSVSGPLNAAERRNALSVLGELSAIEALMTINAEQLRAMLLALEFSNENRVDAFRADEDDGPITALIANGRATYGACYASAEFLDFFDHYNAVTGASLTVPPAGAAP